MQEVSPVDRMQPATQIALRRVGLDDVVGVVVGGPQAGVRGGDFLLQQAGIRPWPFSNRKSKPSSVVAGVGAVRHVLGRRADHDVAVDGRADQHALADLARHRQHDHRHLRTGELVEDEQFAAARVEVEPVEADHASIVSPPRPAALTTHRVRIVPRLVQRPWCRLADLHARRPRCRGAGRAALDGVGGQRDRGRPGADDRLAGHAEPAERARSEVGDRGVDVGGVDDLGPGVAVGFGLGLERRQRVELLVVPGDQQRPVFSTGMPVWPA